jgi:mRNA export factor
MRPCALTQAAATQDSKQRLKAMPRCPASIPCGAFNMDGSMLAYAASYDWSKGAEAHNAASAQNAIYLHATQEVEVKPRPRTSPVGSKR